MAISATPCPSSFRWFKHNTIYSRICLCDFHCNAVQGSKRFGLYHNSLATQLLVKDVQCKDLLLFVLHFPRHACTSAAWSKNFEGVGVMSSSLLGGSGISSWSEYSSTAKGFPSTCMTTSRGTALLAER